MKVPEFTPKVKAEIPEDDIPEILSDPSQTKESKDLEALPPQAAEVEQLARAEDEIKVRAPVFSSSISLSFREESDIEADEDKTDDDEDNKVSSIEHEPHCNHKMRRLTLPIEVISQGQVQQLT